MSYNPAPVWPFIADLPYSKTIRSAIDAAEAAHSEWAEADSAHAEALENLEAAKNDFALAIRTAAQEGKPLPKQVVFADLENAITYASEVERMKRRAASDQVSLLAKVLQSNRAEILRLAANAAEAGATAHSEALKAIQQQLIDVEEARRRSFEGLEMASNYARPELQFSPAFRNEVPQIVIPQHRPVFALADNLREVAERIATPHVEPADDSTEDKPKRNTRLIR